MASGARVGIVAETPARDLIASFAMTRTEVCAVPMNQKLPAEVVHADARIALTLADRPFQPMRPLTHSPIRARSHSGPWPGCGGQPFPRVGTHGAVTSGFQTRAEKTTEAPKDGGCDTGGVIRRDAEEFFHCVTSADDTSMISGKNVHPGVGELSDRLRRAGTRKDDGTARKVRAAAHRRDQSHP